MLHFLRRWSGRPASGGEAGAPPVDFKALAENSLDLIIRCDRDQIASYASPAVTRLLGIGPDEMIGKSHFSYIYPDDRSMLDEVVARHLGGEKEAFATFRMVRKDGTIIWVEGSGSMVAAGASGTPEFVVTMRDVTERKLLEDKLAALAMTDGLTGLPNRRAFDDTLDAEWRRTVREGTTMSVLLLDVDSFKAFNDHYGHQTGDECLRAVGSALARSVNRPGDMAARYGGEEFGVVLAGTDAAGALTVAQAVLAAVRELRVPHCRTLADAPFVSVSIGCATALSRTGASVRMPAGLVQAADSALYKAKDRGRDRVETALLLTHQLEG